MNQFWELCVTDGRTDDTEFIGPSRKCGSKKKTKTENVKDIMGMIQCGEKYGENIHVICLGIRDKNAVV